ncbi:hypothetical protein Cob_v006479 [Colletotrichum orbiculare MAFF 240422]|uniref:Uncharacterized protein n=1 Tax=Colletotrichum orbiculare (strain 104-T / ATCC 96160 / CBS 514.97 / LARS 414 / MAFF 240422) TaxID=1213857 RepID=N4UYP0_COLOR|nr:hypothetical protein Cob_v006479 [Colletotrichum orbiculare MAFF 240422]
MKLSSVSRLFLALSWNISHVFCAILGNAAYTIRDSALAKSVFTTGYKDGKEAVVRVMIDPFDYKITAKSAWNALDKTENRLHLNQILSALWEDDGLRPGEMEAVEYSWIVNEITKTAIRACRQSLGLASDASFKITNKPDERNAWNALLACPFGKVSQRLADAAGKRIVAMQVTDSGLDDLLVQFGR